MSKNFGNLTRALPLLALLCASPLTAQTPPVKDAALPALKDCTRGSLPAQLPSIRWAHKRSLLVAQAPPAHVGADALVALGADATISGKLAYGAASKDLEDEQVELWLSRCDSSGLQHITNAQTDDDGRVTMKIPSKWLETPGRYTARLRVSADGSFVDATLWALPKGSPVIVFDIDGTLTTRDSELFKDLQADLFDPLRSGDYVPAARASGAALTQRWRKLNYPIVYLTGRPYWLTERSRAWLNDGGFAPGALMLASSSKELLPREDSVGAYKLARLRTLLGAGFVIHAAYGNAKTDVFAYKQAGIPAARTFIVGPHGGEQGSQALGADYTAHLKALDAP